MKASACFHKGILASAMIVSLAVASPASYGQVSTQTPVPQYEANSPQHWLGQARQMMAEKRFEVAKQYIELADTLLQTAPVADLQYTPAMARQQLAALVSPSTPPTGKLGAVASPQDVQIAAEALLRARQSLALGDVETATAQTAKAQALGSDFSAVGDSPQAINAMLKTQQRLGEMRVEADPDYNQQAANFLLAQADGLIQYRDSQTSRILVEQAQQFQVPFPSGAHNPQALMVRINALEGNDPQAIAKANAKREALSLLSQAQLAVDQKRWSDATGLVNQAKGLGLSDQDFDADQTLPWQLELKIQNGQKADIAQQTQFDENVANADFIPESDSTKNVTVSGTSAVESNLTDAPTAMALYEMGVEALNANDNAKASEYFQSAIKNPAGLSPAAKIMIKNYASAQPIRDSNVQLAQAQSTLDLNRIRNEQQSAFRTLQSSIYKERAAAEKLLEKSPNQALAKLTAVRTRIANANLAPETQRPLLTLIERDITEIQAYIEENLSEILNEEQNEAARDFVARRAQRRVDTETQVRKLIQNYESLMAERRFEDAGLVVQQATDLAPHFEEVALMSEKYRAERNLLVAQDIKQRRDQGVLLGLEAADEGAIWFDDRKNPLQFADAEQWTERSKIRKERLENLRYSSDAERDIWNTLRQTEVEGEYVGTLAEAMGQLSRQAAVNIVFDNVALEEAGIQTDQLINVPLTNPVKLENALNIILGNARLTYSVENEVVKVTTPRAKNGKTKAETYYIGDLVMPMNSHLSPLDTLWRNQPYQNQPYQNARQGGALNVNGAEPTTIPRTQNTLALAQQLGGGVQGNPFGGLGGSQGFGGPAYPNIPFGSAGGGQLGGVTQADFTPLIDLIQSTIQSDSWEDSGTGEGTIQAYPANLSLVVNNTQEVQDEIVDLLKKLRELNDVQIVIEVRFITLADSFFERVGIDFDFALNDNAPLGFDPNGDNVGESQVVGNSSADLTGGGVSPLFTPTGNLDLVFSQSGFDRAVPQFGNFDLPSAANFGFAILSDIEVFFLIQASKGSSRSNITNSPTVTMFNGQSATVTDGFQRPFVTSVQPVVGDFAVANQPIITILPEGTNLNVAAVVSNDRRSVRMTLVPQFTEIGEVEEFTFEGSSQTTRTSGSFLDDLLNLGNGGLADDDVETTSTGVTIQLPIIATTSVSTVVSVPDGGTILLGGIKRTSESRIEDGVPFLSNIPYINRLFKNVGIGRDTTNLMMMVTPRIIIQAEEEARQIGDTSN